MQRKRQEKEKQNKVDTRRGKKVLCITIKGKSANWPDAAIAKGGIVSRSACHNEQPCWASGHCTFCLSSNAWVVTTWWEPRSQKCTRTLM